MKPRIMPSNTAIIALAAALLALSPARAGAQQAFRLVSEWTSPGGVVQISTDGPITDLSARVGGEELYIAPKLPPGSVFVAEFDGANPDTLDSVYYKTKELLRFATEAGKGTMRVELPAEALAESYLPITVYSGDSGRRYSPYIPFNAYDYDDFSLSGIRIETPDGRVLKPSSIVVYYGNDLTAFKPYNEDKVYEFGNGGPAAWDDSKILMAVFAFEMPIEFARDFELDISGLSLKEGNASVDLAREGKKLATLPFKVDATAPRIDIKAPRGDSPLRGGTTLDASAVDSGSGNVTIEASLDGSRVELPFVFQAAGMTGGTHRFLVRARDSAGNESEAVYAFRIADENPSAPAISLPAKGSGDQATIALTDPQKDALSVELRRGWRLTASEGSVIAVADIYPRDPPLSLEGPAEIFLEPEALSAVDGEVAETSSLTGFPGHRFEINVPEASIDSIRIAWQGATLPGRHISAWTWDFGKERWIRSASGGSGSFSWNLDPVRQVRAGKAHVLVLDPPDAIDSPFTLAWMSDPQYYAESFPNIYANLATWLAGKYKTDDISYLVDTGDIVNKSLERRQWVVADASMKILEAAGMPYGAISGNHDIQHEQRVYDAYLYYFGDRRYSGEPRRGGSWQGGVHHYDLVSFGAYDFMFLFIGNGYETDPEGLAWADSALKAYPDRIAVISTHYYLNANGTKSPGGKAIYDKLVVPNDNVRLVLCGHIHGAATVTQRIGRADGSARFVTEMLADYQSNPFGGEGYIRLLTFDPSKSKLSVRTYSPWLDKWNSFGKAKDEFDLAFEFPEPVKQLSTDYFAAEVFGTFPLASFGPVASGSAIMVDAPAVGWYARAWDAFGGAANSAVIMPGETNP